MIVIKIALFLLGIFLGSQLIGALYGIIDLWYTIRTAYLRVVRNLLIWCAVIGATGFIVDVSLRPAFLGGIVTFAVWHVVLFWLFVLNAKMAARPTGNK